MALRKRKRAWYIEHASFPDEVSIEQEKRNSQAPVTAASVSNAWQHCGDGFQIASSLEIEGSLEKSSKVKNSLVSLLSSTEVYEVENITKKWIKVQTKQRRERDLFRRKREERASGISKTENCREFTNIVWSSSESDCSDDENKAAVSDITCIKMKKCRKHASNSKEECNKDEPQSIDWGNDSDYEDDEKQYCGSKANDGLLDIWNPDSCTRSTFRFDGENKDEHLKAISTEISEYSSDDENQEERNIETEATNLQFPKKFQFSFGVGIETDTKRSATDWLKSAQILLQTPKKKTEKSVKTPEDSAKKKKLLRGGLAERLNRLQNRKRSAINLWRHQYTSHCETLSGGKLGVLIVKILELHEECTLCVAVCHQLGQICADGSSTEEIAEIQPRLKVLFAKETAAHLKAAPHDVIYIHPPWQKLFLLNENIPVIMNTYLSQKVIFKEPTDMSTDKDSPHLLTKRNICLAWIFNLSDIKDSSWSPTSTINQGSCCSIEASENVDISINTEPKVNGSLLDVVEIQGTAEGTEIQVPVVIQRVYYLVADDGFKCHQQGNNLPPNMIPLQNLRLCLLVQDIYGIFSEIQFPVLFSSSQMIEQCIKKWEGKYCYISGLKILQKVTRGRTLGLFSIIDSLWPPLLPLQVSGNRQGNEMQVTGNQPPPGFCYILASDPHNVDADEREQVSNIYFPPAVHSLKETYQMCDFPQRCSFWGYVVYQRLQGTDNTPLDQRQFWLFVTDFSLQNEPEISCRTPKTLPVSVASSCVIDVEVMEALKSTSPCRVFFKDALCGNDSLNHLYDTPLGKDLDVLFWGAKCNVSSRAIGDDITELTGPVKLDDLDSATQINSICTVRGTIVGINEFSCPTCNRCGHGNVEQHPQDKGLLYCSHCCEAITSPVFKMHQEIFLKCQSQPKSTVKVKLLQQDISSILDSSPKDDGSYEGKSVLRREVGLLNCYVQSVSSHPSSCIRLEEIVLPVA